MVNWRLPLDRTRAATRNDCRDENIFLPEPQQDLTDRMKFGEFLEDKQNTVLNAPIGILLDTVVVGLHVADSDGKMQLAAPRFLAHRLDRPLTEDRQLHFAHRA